MASDCAGGDDRVNALDDERRAAGQAEEGEGGRRGGRQGRENEGEAHLEEC